MLFLCTSLDSVFESKIVAIPRTSGTEYCVPQLFFFYSLFKKTELHTILLSLVPITDSAHTSCSVSLLNILLKSSKNFLYHL